MYTIHYTLKQVV